MKDFQNLLRESLDSPYKWKWVIKEEREMHVIFYDSENRRFIVRCLRLFGTVWGIAFGEFHHGDFIDYSNTGYGDSRRMLSTILEVTMDFLKTVGPAEVRFTGEVVEGKAQLYKKMLHKTEPTFNNIGYTHDFVPKGDKFIFFITKMKQENS